LGESLEAEEALPEAWDKVEGCKLESGRDSLICCEINVSLPNMSCSYFVSISNCDFNITWLWVVEVFKVPSEVA
jgi:hypothetical protein